MYHYTESGLRNVWLENGFRKVKTSEGVAVAIEDLEGLHRVIGGTIARKPSLTGTELRFLRKEMGLSQKALAQLLGSEEQTVSLWERRGRMPKTADRLFRLMYLEWAEGKVEVQRWIQTVVEQDEHDSDDLHLRHAGKWKVAA